MRNYLSPYKAFVFESYSFDAATGLATFEYSFDGTRTFTERMNYGPVTSEVDGRALDAALRLAFYLVGTSYYKAFPTSEVVFKTAAPDAWQAAFLQEVYTKGLSQFLYENDLSPKHLVHFNGETRQSSEPQAYAGSGVVALQSGGKDSLLLAKLLGQHDISYAPWYIASGEYHPDVLNQLPHALSVVQRSLDRGALAQAAEDGGLNGHVPVTFIVLSYAVIQAILSNKNTVLAAIGTEGEEPHDFIDDLPVNHQWSKTWHAEQLFAQYVERYISKDIHVGSPLRGLSEMRIAELFVENCWPEFGKSFSSCNAANYQQGEDNTRLRWCGECPKCANSYILFAPFVAPDHLQQLFGGEDLYAKPSLEDTFKGLLGVDGVMKPFECVGEIDELRLAYHMAEERFRGQLQVLPFTVPGSRFAYKRVGPSQDLKLNILPSMQ